MKAGEEAGAPAGEAVPADVGVPEDDAADVVSEDVVSEDSVSEDAVSEDSVSADAVSADDGEDSGGGDRDDEPDDEAKPARRAGAPIWLTAMTVLVALLIAGVVTVAINLSDVRGDNAQASSRAAAISVARTAVTDLTTANYRDPQRYVQKLKPLAVGTFLSQFTNSASGFEDLLTQGKVQTTGRVVDVGVQRLGSGTAQLTVLVYETVKNSQTPKGSQRAYRMTVSMIQSGSQWLVSNVESVA
jgi:Mce-associated membrane protein